MTEMKDDLKKTPLFNEHLRLKAKMVDFSGWSMPLQYSSIIEEVKAVRENIGMFDVSHMGEFLVKGPDTEKFIDKVITNSFSTLKNGEICYSPICNENGGIIDDLLVYKFSNQKAMIVVNASNISKDFNWFKKQAESFRVDLFNISEETALIAVQGPKTEEVLQEISQIVLKDIEYYCFTEGRVNGIKVLISRTGYTGEDGFELYVSPDASIPLWRKILEVGQSVGIKPCGLGARDVLRLEAAYMLYGNDIDENTTPLEASLTWTVKFEKEDFIGKNALLEQKEQGLEKVLKGFVISGKAIARHGDKILKDEKEVGYITSGTKSPTLDKSIALGYVKKDFAKINEEFIVKIRDKDFKATIVKLPFYRGTVKSKTKKKSS
ncbi:MAG: aminomethyltransferase [Thermotogaceae bacterium]|nr:aminomethyltransferase [Thermotogaceae bacterium]MDN5336941.1 aminomethyltransferase [Thermotogaceae bacterium]